MRKQYFFRESERGLLAWDVDRLCELSRDLPRKSVPLAGMRELDDVAWREEAEHAKLIDEADLSYPIILSANGEVMDGRHRLAKAAMNGCETIEAVQFETDPEPDYVGRGPDDLPY
jgi:ParB-like chromosome segregation protein Spo0J